MTDQQKLIAFARAMGFTDVKPSSGYKSNNPKFAFTGKKPTSLGRIYIPNWPGSLDAMHEVEKTLTDAQYERFRLELWNLTTDNERPIHNESAPTRLERAYLSSTAAQRFDAMGRTLGLWT